MEIDIRTIDGDKVKTIRFDTQDEDALFADVLNFYRGDCDVWLNDSSDNTRILGIRNKKVAYNIIKAIQKAIDLGWFD